MFLYDSITSGNSNTSFSIDSNGTLSTTTWLDYETTPSFALSVQARDSSSPSSSQKSVVMEISIDITPVNEHAPVFSSVEYSANIAEDVSVGTSILRVSAVDQDDGLQGTMNEQKAFHESNSKWPALSSSYFGLLFYIK